HLRLCCSSAAGFQKISVPKFQNQHPPQQAGTIAACTQMFVNQHTHCLRLKITSLECARLDEHLQELLLQFFSHSVHQRQLESLLTTMHQWGWNPQSLGKPLQNILAGVVPELPADGQSGGPLDKLVIEHGHSYFQ